MDRFTSYCIGVWQKKEWLSGKRRITNIFSSAVFGENPRYSLGLVLVTVVIVVDVVVLKL